MASILQKILRKPPSSSTKLLTSLNNNPKPTSLSQNPSPPNLFPFLNSFDGAGSSEISPAAPISYPQFPFGYCLNPISSSGSPPFEGPVLSTFLNLPHKAESLSSSSVFYPSFPFGHLNSISSFGSGHFEPEGDVLGDDSNAMWADSVKKKRKKKMNKHKYKKLRKRVRGHN